MVEPKVQTFRVRTQLPFKELNWPVILSVLKSRFKLSLEQANVATENFRQKLSKPLNIVWFQDKPLSGADQMVAAAACEAHGADIMTVTLERSLNLVSLSLGYKQAVCFEPSFRGVGGNEADALATAKISLALLGMEIELDSRRKLILVQIALAALAMLSFAIFSGILLYGLAVLLHFIVEPASVTVTATRKAPIGLALLCMLIGIAGIFGRAVYNVVKLAVTTLRRSKN